MFQYVDGFGIVPLSGIYSGNLIRNINGGGLSSMGGKQEPITEPTRYEKNRAAFLSIQYHWETVKIGYLREIDGVAKNEIERIYKEELDPKWLPNRYCKGCYFNAINDLIYHFKL